MRILIKILAITLLLSFFLASCRSSDEDILQDVDDLVEVALTEALVAKGVSYGPESRQFVDIYKPASACPTPIYFDAHGNGGNTSIPDDIVEDLNALGITVIAWESLTSINTPEEVQTGWDDADLMFQWVLDNAESYNFDTSQWIIGGSSRGSILSWKYGHSTEPNVKGLYMYNALPGNAWTFPDFWYPPNDVTLASPPIQFVYKREPGSSIDPIEPDIHDPNNGITIVETYEEFGIGDITNLVHSIGETDNTDKYQFLVDFAISVIETCPN